MLEDDHFVRSSGAKKTLGAPTPFSFGVCHLSNTLQNLAWYAYKVDAGAVPGGCALL